MAVAWKKLAFSEDIISDHGDLTGLSDDDHAQYLLADGARAVTNLTATKPVFTDGSKRLTSSGIMPLNQGGTGATTKANAQVVLGVFAGSSTFNGSTGVSVSIGATLAGTNYKVSIVPTGDPLNVGPFYVTTKTTTEFTVKCSGFGTPTFDWVLIDLN